MKTEERQAVEHACARLIHLYATLNDQSRWEEIVALYAPDGLMTRPTAPDQPIIGHADLLAAFRSRPPRTTQHICSNILVTVETAQTASATSAILLFTAAETAPMVGTYRDRFVCNNATWHFTERRGALTFLPQAGS